jgi:hypothetical protein
MLCLLYVILSRIWLFNKPSAIHGDVLWCELGTRLLIYLQGSLTLARAAQTADGDLKWEPPSLHLALFPGSGVIPWAHLLHVLSVHFTVCSQVTIELAADFVWTLRTKSF